MMCQGRADHRRESEAHGRSSEERRHEPQPFSVTSAEVILDAAPTPSARDDAAEAAPRSLRVHDQRPWEDLQRLPSTLQSKPKIYIVAAKPERECFIKSTEGYKQAPLDDQIRGCTPVDFAVALRLRLRRGELRPLDSAPYEILRSAELQFARKGLDVSRANRR